ncbi:hypothetical protein BD410DRAFT_732649 [Rickenella mellea]|uniref:C2H2-type domain-containing protein n=1 Tax=Rickenella mellea TaxID=50990 RepID=A0A4Y7PJV2_9AGAM|nr:hypothetical protein BD410DRAFT_732649 [Rickenella mellea]
MDSNLTSRSATNSDNGRQTVVRRKRRLSCLDFSCGRTFMSEYTRSLHMRTHQPKTRYPCQMGCSETFSRQHDRLRHEVAKHGKQWEWPCTRCRQFFSSQATRDRHKCSNRASSSLG